MTIVDRETRCFLAIEAVVHRSQEIAQQMVNQAPAQQYYSDQFPLYDSLSYRRGCHLSLADKSETYAVEGGNADLRHYLTRLARRSRCFSRCLVWLNRHLKAFAHAWNRRQLHNRARPFDKRPVIDFLCLLD
jgi:IS1 family transposase